ncbi:MAG: hypothetical protein GXP27_18120 [Planctomycetes bacterium]|nr:hypothetical protein [Planctomycetota bacterium]
MYGNSIRILVAGLLVALVGASAWAAEGSAERQHPKTYPHLNAPLYPSPQPHMPVGVGGVVYTNQAFAPHELLYAHKYRGLYPPYYFKVNGLWWWTPFGMESHDTWKLQGTWVKVKYHSRLDPLSRITSPFHASDYVGLTFRYLQSLLVETGELFR